SLGIAGKICLGVAITVGLQLFGVIWWAASLTHRIEQLERTVSRTETLIERMATIETDVRWIRGEMERQR
ncbi:MAG: hypothetical protein FWH25_04355, partial [Syntrophorhabdaceae bacterium]|nr:hypothetical protein [Syntrophorhabdaceae bacterium]